MFTYLARQLNNESELFIFTTDHGGSMDGRSFLWLWNEGILYDSDFASTIESLPARTINIVMEQCYSGGFIDDIQMRCLDKNIVITTACSGNEVSYAMPSLTYDEFVYHWLTAVNGVSPDNSDHSDADFNQDGYISMLEAYQDATINDTREETPQQYSNPECLTNSLSLDALLDICDNQLLVGGVDLYMKDNNFDIGDEPNTTTDESWISNDVWFEDMNGAKTYSLVAGHGYNVCVRVRNRGDQDSYGYERLYVHWTKAVIGGSWPHSWYSDIPYECDGHAVIRGDLITDPSGFLLPFIPAGKEEIVKIPWIAPNYDYSVCSAFDGRDNELWHYCLLARIDEQDGTSYDGEMPLREFVLDHNNVISRNFSLMRDNGEGNGSVSAVVGVSLPDGMPSYFDIHIDIEESAIGLGHDIDLRISLSDNLYNNWGGNGFGWSEEEAGTFRITDFHSELTDFYMNTNSLGAVKATIEFLSDVQPPIEFDISMVQDGQKIGGEHFFYASYNINPPQYREQNRMNEATYRIERNSSIYNVIANFSIDHLFVSDFGANRLLSAQGSSINISSLASGFYILTIVSDNGVYTTPIFRQ